MRQFKAIFFFIVCVGAPFLADAASLSFSPSSGAYAVGNVFSASVYIASPNEAINAVSGTISFPKDKLEVVSVSKVSSVISLWVQEPSFSNGSGTVNFEGVVLNPGFTGSKGKVLTVTFKIKGSGSAELYFSSSSALLNDGMGTNVMDKTGGALFSISKVPLQVADVLTAPKISSITHPDSDIWYSKNAAQFAWELPSDVTGVRLAASRSADVVPTAAYAANISSKDIVDLDDGVWYFAVRFRSGAGWGEIARFPFRVDTEKPFGLNITEIPYGDTATEKARFSIHAADAVSGIGHYEISIDGGVTQVWDGAQSYVTPTLASGKHILSVTAVDRAGNAVSASQSFMTAIATPPAAIEYPKTIALFGSWAIKLLSIAIPLISLLFVLLFIIWYAAHRLLLLRKRFKRELLEAELESHKSFSVLKNGISKQIKALEKIHASLGSIKKIDENGKKKSILN